MAMTVDRVLVRLPTWLVWCPTAWLPPPVPLPLLPPPVLAAALAAIATLPAEAPFRRAGALDLMSRRRRRYSPFLTASARASLSRRTCEAAAKLSRAAPAFSSEMSSSVR